MGDALDETRTLRRRLAGVQARGSASTAGHASYCQAVVVYDAGHIPTTVPNQFAVKPIRATGRIGEGLAATVSTGTRGFVATFLGPHVPAAGDRYVVRQAGGRWVADGGTVAPSSCARACVRTLWCGAPLPGVAVELVVGGVTVASGVSVGQVVSIAIAATGSGYTPGSPPSVTISGGGGAGATAVAVMNAAGTAVASFFMTDFGSGYTSTPSVTVAPPTSGTTAAGTATVAALACLEYTNSGAATIRGGKTNYATATSSVTLSCNSTIFDLVMFATVGTVSAGVAGCGDLFLQGANVTFVQGTTTVSGSTDAAGQVTLGPVAIGVAGTMTVTASRFATATATVTPANCGGGGSFGLVAATGFECSCADTSNLPFPCLVPIPETLFMTDPVFGGVTLDLDGGSPASWRGNLTVAYLGCVDCPADSVVLHYRLYCNVIGVNGGKFFLEVTWENANIGGHNCPQTGGLSLGGSGSATTTSMSCPPLFSATLDMGATVACSPWGLHASNTFVVTE